MDRTAARVAAFAAAGLVLVALLPLVADTDRANRTFVLEARDMRFVSAGSGAVNPVLRVRPREQVSVVLRNREPGLLHDFAVPSLNIAMDALRTEQDGRVTFRAPSAPGRYEYVCRPHATMMKGIIEVRD